MAVTLNFPTVEAEIIVETEQMRRAANRILAVHPYALAVFHGQSGTGKTTTARWTTGGINEHHRPDDPSTFRALHYEVAEIPAWSGQEQKRAIRSLYHAAIGRLDEGLYRQLPGEDLARHLVHALARKSIRQIFVDEAGTLSLDALRGLVLVRDVAENLREPLSFCFVGMDDLPLKLERLPQIKRRVHEWVYFEEYDLKETWKLLAKLHPHFASLDARNPDHWEQVEFVHQTFGGVIGNFTPFLKKLSRRLRDYKGEIGLKHLMAVHDATNRDRERALESARTQYRAAAPETSGKGGDAA